MGNAPSSSRRHSCCVLRHLRSWHINIWVSQILGGQLWSPQCWDVETHPNKGILLEWWHQYSSIPKKRVDSKWLTRLYEHLPPFHLMTPKVFCLDTSKSGNFPKKILLIRPGLKNKASPFLETATGPSRRHLASRCQKRPSPTGKSSSCYFQRQTVTFGLYLLPNYAFKLRCCQLGWPNARDKLRELLRLLDP